MLVHVHVHPCAHARRAVDANKMGADSLKCCSDVPLMVKNTTGCLQVDSFLPFVHRTIGAFSQCVLDPASLLLKITTKLSVVAAQRMGSEMLT